MLYGLMNNTRLHTQLHFRTTTIIEKAFIDIVQLRLHLLISPKQISNESYEET